MLKLKPVHFYAFEICFLVTHWQRRNFDVELSHGVLYNEEQLPQKFRTHQRVVAKISCTNKDTTSGLDRT